MSTSWSTRPNIPVRGCLTTALVWSASGSNRKALTPQEMAAGRKMAMIEIFTTHPDAEKKAEKAAAVGSGRDRASRRGSSAGTSEEDLEPQA